MKKNQQKSGLLASHVRYKELRLPIKSSLISSIGYHKDKCELDIEFTSGAVYKYFSLPASIVEELLSAPSAGRYFNAVIRDRYPVWQFEQAVHM